MINYGFAGTARSESVALPFLMMAEAVQEALWRFGGISIAKRQANAAPWRLTGD